MTLSNNIIFGLRSIIEAINANQTIEKVFLQKGLQGALYVELISLLKRKHITSSFVPVEKLETLSKFQNHQGAVARISPISFVPIEDLIESTLEKEKTPLFLLLDHITDVRNFGAIIRTSECTGVDGIIIPETGSAPITAATIKTSAGAAFKIPISKVNHIKDALFYLQSAGISIVAATEKTANSIYDIDLSIPTAIIMGSEERGINPSILKMADAKAKLPLLGSIESLNVSVACGAILYEVVRQRIAK
jgi:23S rRNA (guanosine2251-2'-O)-methyltransferase